MILEGRGLRRAYGSTVAVEHIDIAVSRGQVVGLLGPNGAGKSTTFGMLCGTTRPDRGVILLDGADVTREPLHRRARRGLAYLPQHSSVFPRLSARDNVIVALDAMGRPRSDAESLLEQAGLGARASHIAGSLSGGERRRLEIARCLALRPVVILLDEPFAGIDPLHVAELRSTVRDLAARDIGVLLTDHAVAAAMSACDRVVLIDRGVVQVEGTPSEVAADPLARSTYLGHDFCIE